MLPLVEEHCKGLYCAQMLQCTSEAASFLHTPPVWVMFIDFIQALWHTPFYTHACPVSGLQQPGWFRGPNFSLATTSVEGTWTIRCPRPSTGEARRLMGRPAPTRRHSPFQNQLTHSQTEQRHSTEPALQQPTSRLTSLTGGNFFLHSMDRDRRSVCMFSNNFFTASGLLVDIFDGVFDRNLKKLQKLKEYRSVVAPLPAHPRRGT